VECEIDIYFDHRYNPLPWDSTRADRYTTIPNSSINFLANYPRSNALNHPNYPVAWRKLREPPRPGDDFFATRSPFIDPQTGQGLRVQGLYGYVHFTGYDKEVFPGFALLTLLDTGCDGGKNIGALVLANAPVSVPVDIRNKAIVRAVVLPNDWRDRIQQATKDHRQQQEAFFKQEIERAINSLGGKTQK
jgi:hypothetical protein